MNNNKQSSVDFFAEKTFNLIELMKSRYVNQEEFLDGMLKAREQAKAMHKEETESKYQEGREIGKIEVLTSQSTKNASEYSQGYNKGFLAALEYMNSTIENKIKLRQYEK